MWLGLVPDVLSPSVGGSCPWASALNTEVILSSDQSEVSSLSPVASPGVSDNPIFSSILFTPTSDWDIVVKFLPSGFIVEDTSGIVDKFSSYRDGTGDGSSLEDFVHHVLLSSNVSEFINAVDFRSLLSPASFLWETVLAFDHCWTSDTIVMSICLVRWTCLVGNVVAMDPFVSSSGITSVASFVGELAWNQNLRTEDHIWPHGFSSDLYSVTQSTSSRKCPTWPTIHWNMLIPLISQIIDPINLSPPEIGR